MKYKPILTLPSLRMSNYSNENSLIVSNKNKYTITKKPHNFNNTYFLDVVPEIPRSING